MSQNTFSNDEQNNAHPENFGAGDAPTANPYYGNVQARQEPDLDAAAPTLRSVEEQRLNRKALLFLGGILVLLVAMGFLLLRKSRDDSAAPVKVNETARVSTPALPAIADAPPPVQELPAEPIPMLPPLPESRNTDSMFASAPLVPAVDQGPSLLDRRIAASSGASGPVEDGGGQELDAYTRAMLAQLPGNQQAAPVGPKRGPDIENISSASLINNPDALLVRGTYLRCVLETRIITDVPGFTSCLVTEPVYSINGRTLLLPKGSKVYGSYGGSPTGDRVSVIWDRITTPNGIDIAMSSPGVDQLGGAGHPGQYSAHWGSRIASALMISLIADGFKYAAAEHGPQSTTVTGSGLAVQSPYESATARSMERLANEALNQRRPPTVTINQGVVVNVYVAKDVDFGYVLPRRR